MVTTRGTAQATPLEAEQRGRLTALEYVTEARGLRVHITRYDNHGNLIPGGHWAVARKLAEGDTTNFWYLSADGVWRYKQGSVFADEFSALSYLDAYPPTI